MDILNRAKVAGAIDWIASRPMTKIHAENLTNLQLASLYITMTSVLTLAPA